MAENIWELCQGKFSKEDVAQYIEYAKNIVYKPLGSIAVDGVYLQDDPSKTHKILADIVFVADNNVDCPHRMKPKSLGSSYYGGRQSAIIIMPSKDTRLESIYGKGDARAFITEGKITDYTTTGDVEDVYMASNYKGVFEQIAKTCVLDFEGRFKEDTYVSSDSGIHYDVLGKTNLAENILPPVVNAYSQEIDNCEEDFRNMAPAPTPTTGPSYN